MTRVALVVPVAVAAVARLVTGPHPIDDAYITFRYARNLAEGLGLVYNPGEWVLGTTAPLWAVILAIGYRLGGTDLPFLASVLSAACDGVSAYLVARFSLRLGWKPLGAALVGLAWALNPLSIAFATGGMETSLFVMVALIALALAARGQLVTAAGLSGLATFVRPEGALLLAAIGGWAWCVGRWWEAPRNAAAMSSRQSTSSAALLAVLAGLAPMAVGGLVLVWRYGSPLPNSIAAKQVAYQPAWPFENGLALLVQAGLPGWSTYLLGVLPAEAGLLVAAAGLAALAALVRGAPSWLDRQGVAWQPFAGFAALYLIFYVLVGLRGVRLFPWYLVPIAPFYLLGAAAGLARLVAHLSSAWPLASSAGDHWRLPLPARPFIAAQRNYQASQGASRTTAESLDGRHRSITIPQALPNDLLVHAGGVPPIEAKIIPKAGLRPTVGGVGRASWLAAVLVLWQLPAIDWRQPLLPAGEALWREQLLFDVGRRLAESMPPMAVVAAPEIGALGYSSNLHMLDTAGLVSPAALPYYPLAADQLVVDNAIPPRLIDDQRPDVVVTLDAFARKSLLPDPAFQRDYRLERSYPAPVWQSQELLLFRRAEPIVGR